MNIISLTVGQRRVKKFKHPAFKDITIHTADALVGFVERRHEKGGEDELILALRSIARYNVARFLWHWPETRRFLDLMVSESLLAIVLLVRGLEPEVLEDSNIQKVASLRIISRIKRALNDVRSIAAPSLRQQYELKDPIYLMSEREPVHEDAEAHDAEQEKIEMLDVLQHMRNECDIASIILSPENWGLTDVDLADKIGIAKSTVIRRRNSLLVQYLKMIGGDDD